MNQLEVIAKARAIKHKKNAKNEAEWLVLVEILITTEASRYGI